MTNLFDARLLWVVQGPCLNVFGNQFTAYFRDLFPVVKDSQGQVFIH
jgi:hypothetical protein